MSRGTRRILFYGLAALFIILGSATIFYSIGWRFDLETFAIDKLGAIFLKKIPGGSAITIEKTDLEFKTGILDSGLLIANLFPKTYNLSVTKDGYRRWEKTIAVQPSLVTEIPSLILLPEKLEFTKIAAGITDFWVGQKSGLLLSADGKIFFKSQPIPGAKIISRSKDGEKIITKSGNNYYYLELKKPASPINVSAAFKNLKNPQNLDFDPARSAELFIQNETGLYLANLKSQTLETVSGRPIESFVSGAAGAIFIAEGSLFLNSQNKNPLNLNEPVKEIKLSPDQNKLLILTASGKSYLTDAWKPKLKLLAQNAIQSEFSSEGTKLALTTKNKEVVIYNLQNSGADPPIILNIGAPAETRIQWLKNSEYLLVQYPENLYLLEASAFPPINFQLISSGVKKFEYSGAEDLIYVLRDDSLYSLELK